MDVKLRYAHGMLLVGPDEPFTTQQKKFYMEIALLSAIERSDNPDYKYKVTYKVFVLIKCCCRLEHV